MEETIVEVVDLVKTYSTRSRTPGKRWGIGNYIEAILGGGGTYITALDKVSFRIGKGEIFGLLGLNGAGKTTLIKVLCTLCWPDSGDAFVNGFSVTKRPGHALRNLQAVFAESKGFEWRLTASENLKFFAGLYGLTGRAAEQRIDYLLEYVGLKTRSNDMFQKFSTGMMRKLLLCRALLIDVPVLLLDEPTVGLDPISSFEFRQLLRSISREQGKTILLSTHNMWEADSLCDKIAIINRGKIIASGTPLEIRQLVSRKSILTVTSLNSLQGPEKEAIVRRLYEVPGVLDVSIVGESSQEKKLLVGIERGVELADLLGIIARSGFGVKSIVTSDPSLEEAFASLVTQGKR